MLRESGIIVDVAMQINTCCGHTSYPILLPRVNPKI